MIEVVETVVAIIAILYMGVIIIWGKFDRRGSEMPKWTEVIAFILLRVLPIICVLGSILIILSNCGVLR